MKKRLFLFMSIAVFVAACSNKENNTTVKTGISKVAFGNTGLNDCADANSLKNKDIIKMYRSVIRW